MHTLYHIHIHLCVISVSACHTQQPKPIQETVHFQWRYWGECMLSVIACLLSFSFLFYFLLFFISVHVHVLSTIRQKEENLNALLRKKIFKRGMGVRHRNWNLINNLIFHIEILRVPELLNCLNQCAMELYAMWLGFAPHSFLHFFHSRYFLLLWLNLSFFL